MDLAGRQPAILALAATVSWLAVIAGGEAASRAESGPGNTVRGMVRQERPDGSVTAAPSFKVTLSSAAAAARTTLTTAKGFFYFRNVPPGAYTLAVGAEPLPKRYEVRVEAAPYTELPPVILEARLQNIDKAYASIQEAMDLEDWSGALFVLQQIVQLRPETKQNRNSPMPAPHTPFYRPHYYLGVAYFHLGDCRRARDEWQQEERLGGLLYEHHQVVQTLLPKCAHSGP